MSTTSKLLAALWIGLLAALASASTAANLLTQRLNTAIATSHKTTLALSLWLLLSLILIGLLSVAIFLVFQSTLLGTTAAEAADIPLESFQTTEALQEEEASAANPEAPEPSTSLQWQRTSSIERYSDPTPGLLAELAALEAWVALREASITRPTPVHCAPAREQQEEPGAQTWAEYWNEVGNHT